MRQEGAAFVKINLDVENLQKQIPPLLLSPLVENALKHGIVTSKHSSVEISLQQKGKHLRFVVTNKIANQKKDGTGGIGLENLKKRLSIYFPKQHDLHLRKENERFTAELEIYF